MRPERALRADRSLRIVRALFMWATDDAFRRNDRLDPMILDEPQNLAADVHIRAHIPVLGQPAMEGGRLGVLHRQDANCYFRGVFVVRAIECDRRDWITAEAPTGFPLPRRIRVSLDSHLMTSVAHAARSTQTAHGVLARFPTWMFTGGIAFGGADPVNHGRARSSSLLRP